MDKVEKAVEESLKDFLKNFSIAEAERIISHTVYLIKAGLTPEYYEYAYNNFYNAEVLQKCKSNTKWIGIIGYNKG
jgi:hypothetical protein